jgi:hypothetical protein
MPITVPASAGLTPKRVPASETIPNEALIPDNLVRMHYRSMMVRAVVASF